MFHYLIILYVIKQHKTVANKFILYSKNYYTNLLMILDVLFERTIKRLEEHALSI